MIARKSSSNPKAIELYGTIWAGDGAWLLRDIQALAPTGDLTVHIHSPGGNVTDGNLIMNYIKKRKGRKIAIVDGVAASMAAILLTAFDEVHIANNAFIMIHQPSMSTSGNAKAFEQSAKLLNSITKQFTDAIMAKTGADEDTVKEWLTGDTWFTADEALTEKLVDAVVDPVLEDAEVTAFYQMDIAALSESFPEYKRTEESTTDQIVNPTAEGSSADLNNKNKEEMKLNAISLSILALAATATEEEINAKIAELGERAEKVPALTAQLEQIQNERVESLVGSAVAAGKIPAAKKENFVALANKDFDLAKETIEALPAKANITAGLPNGNKLDGSTDPRANWTWDDYRKKDTAGLLKIKAEEPERYAALAAEANVSLK